MNKYNKDGSLKDSKNIKNKEFLVNNLLNETDSSQEQEKSLKLEEPKLWIYKNNCEGCSRFRNSKCKADLKICGCNKPELLTRYSKFDWIGFCKNCGHFIISLNNNSWEHYTRAYKCSFPYHELTCKAPHSDEKEEIKEMDPDIEKTNKSQSNSRFKNEELKALNELIEL